MVGIEIELREVELRIGVVLFHRLLQPLHHQPYSLLVGKLRVVDTKVVLRLRVVLRRRLPELFNHLVLIAGNSNSVHVEQPHLALRGARSPSAALRVHATASRMFFAAPRPSRSISP